jgi:hypothetical protein
MVHEAAFADQSPELERLMPGEMSEGLAGEAKWEDVDKGTFITICPIRIHRRLFNSENDC